MAKAPLLGGMLAPVGEVAPKYSVAVKDTLLMGRKPDENGWLKLKPVLPPPVTEMKVTPGVVAGVPTVLKQPFMPHVTSKVSNGFVREPPVILMTTIMLLVSGLETVPCQG